ncbi:probable methyltransferase TARBP1 [Camelus ferus]|uniref:Probable methyltransferase TARBP1 n=1 Tax=Camelus ferus TaxID=419612 RepID=A0A8B8TWY2_CAMFR|nr:probable methyltransferase TARBP1 [Camelus ferus]
MEFMGGGGRSERISLQELAVESVRSAPRPKAGSQAPYLPARARASRARARLPLGARPRRLAGTLIAQRWDPRVLLGALCRGEASAERVETLRFLLQRLEDQEASGGGGARGPRPGTWCRCCGACACAPHSGSPAHQRRRLLRAAGAALRSCARLAGGPQEALRDLVAVGLAPGLEGASEAAVEVLAAVGPCLRPREDAALLERVAQAALGLALGGDEAGPAEEAAALVARRLLPALGQCGGAALRAVGGGLVAPGAPSGLGLVGPQLLVLSALAEKLLPEPGAELFCRTVQAGLAQAEDALTRKRARYLLQRAVEVSAELGAQCACAPQEGTGPSLCWWSEKEKDELLKFWENYILIMETLEGNQIHVIKPVLSKLNNLFEYAVSEENGCWLFHPSWHLCIYKRMFESGNKILTKEGVTHFLELYETRVLPFSPEFSEAAGLMTSVKKQLFGVSVLSRSQQHEDCARSLSAVLFHGPESLKSCCLSSDAAPPVLIYHQTVDGRTFRELSVLQFPVKVYSEDDKTSRHWCAVPILLLSKALANIPRCKALGIEGLLILSHVASGMMSTQERNGNRRHHGARWHQEELLTVRRGTS